MTDREKMVAKRLSTISEKWGNYRTETSKGMRELCMDFEWLLTTCEQLVSELDREREENRKLVNQLEELQESLIAARENAHSANIAKEYLDEENRKLLVV